MGGNLIALSVVIFYMLALFTFSFYAKNKLEQQDGNTENSEGFLLANRSFGTILVMVSIMGSALGANGTVGIAQNGYLFGISAGWYDGAFAIGIIITAFLFVRKLRSLNLSTISQIYGDYYGEKTRTIASAGQIFMNFAIMISQHIAGGAILSTLLPEYFTMTSGMILSAGIFLSIALIGGMMSAGMTNVINIIFLYFSVGIGLYFSLKTTGGYANMISQLPDIELFTHPIDGLTKGVFISYLLLFLANVPTGQPTVQMAFSAKNDKSAFWGYLLGGLLVLPFGFATATMGMAARAIFPDLGIANSALALPKIVMTFPPLVAGLVLSGMWAADVSTATGLILGNSTLFITDIIEPFRKNPMTGKEEVALSRVLSIIFTLITLFCAFYVKFLLQFITMGLSLSVAYFIILIATLYFPKSCKKRTASLTLISSFIVILAWMLIPSLQNVFSHVVYPQLIVCSITFILVSILDNKPALFVQNNIK